MARGRSESRALRRWFVTVRSAIWSRCGRSPSWKASTALSGIASTPARKGTSIRRHSPSTVKPPKPSFGLPGVLFSTAIIPPATPSGGKRSARAQNEISTASPVATGPASGIASCTDQSRRPGLATSTVQPCGLPATPSSGPNIPVAIASDTVNGALSKASAEITGVACSAARTGAAVTTRSRIRRPSDRRACRDSFVELPTGIIASSGIARRRDAASGRGVFCRSGECR